MNSLGYQVATPEAGRTLRVDSTDDRLVITWPSPPEAKLWYEVGIAGALAFISLAATGWFIYVALRVDSQNAEFPFLGMPVMFGSALVFAGAFTFNVYDTFRLVRRRHNWGPVPRKLTVDRNHITLDWLGYRRMRRRMWFTSDVVDADWRVTRDLFRKQIRLVFLRIRIRRHRARSFILDSTDVELLALVRDELSRYLGPLRVSAKGRSVRIGWAE